MRLILNILPKELEEIINTGEFGDDGGIRITSLDYFVDDSKVVFSLDSGDEDKLNQLWELQIDGLRDQRISIDWANNLEFYSLHFLLWEFSRNHTSLYFKRKADNPNKLIADIFKTHRAVFGKWFDVEKYVSSFLFGLCNESNGLFANGPKEILEYCYRVLERNNAEPYYYGSSEPKRWNGEQWVIEDKDLKLLIMGDSYFIGRNFTFQQV